MHNKTFAAVLIALTLSCAVAWGQGAPTTAQPILAGPLAKLDIKDAEVSTVKGKPRGTLNIGLHFGIDPTWVNPLEYVPFAPYYDMAERILNDLRTVGIRGKLQMLDAPAYMAQVAQGRKGTPGNRTIIHSIDPRPGGAKASIGLYAVCGGNASFVCEPQIEELWAKHQAGIDLAERDRLIKAIQRIVVGEYYIVPLYLNPFVHAVGPRVLPEGEAVHRYWDTLHAPFPWPWEVWEVKG